MSDEFDDKAEKLYNNAKDADGGVSINMKHRAPLNDSKCKHDYQHDPDDADNSWAKVFKCTKCCVGYLESL